MTKRKIAVLVLAAGAGTRMKSARAKVLHPLAGRPMIAHLMASVARLGPDRVVAVVGRGMRRARGARDAHDNDVARAVRPHPVVVQHPRLGTAHAVLAARPRLAGFAGAVLVLYGDTPLIGAATLKRMLAALASPSRPYRGASLKARGVKPARPAVVVLGFRPAEPAAYGRLVVGADGGLERIVEAGDATPEERAIGLCNAGAMAFDGAALFGLLARIKNVNAKREYYLTDAVAIAREQGRVCAVVEASGAEALGVNSRADLARAERAVQQELRARALEGGATLLDPETVWFSFDTRLGRDVTVGPNVVFGPGVRVGDGVEIRGFCHIEGATIAPRAIVGPFARLRPGARIGPSAHVGNFVEIKNAVLDRGAKANHLAYIGDARVGANANVGAGTITCNYDGAAKHFTDIGAGAFIGSNAALVAPVKIGNRAVVGAGSVISRNVAPGALALARPKQMEVKGWAARIARRAKKKKKAR
ncbi:MAG: bifunctional UDP-N-acetylglucosamine diphosphorylase/glucosamine-1-phosphate N-acetyltransferase GlmU [Rhodospirillales bacterium]|nr:bifunctional UDP-N-acetylglucosamine diphosphorylase/glucosamine-1-phosphate N-acetyltransferase GlmU [Rhodospirillales bacterium]